MENYIYTPHRTYIVEVFECDDGMYKLEIHDDNGTYHYPKYFIIGVYHDPKEFMECTTKGFRAVNLTEDDVQAFFDKVCDSI